MIISFCLFLKIEYERHQKNIYSIPIRIHINGTRGKSSVTRLIGSALLEGGIKTVTKVTGTFPRLIMDDGSEIDVQRKSGANIIEQLEIVKFAVKNQVQALVIECMALDPFYQWITENKMIHSTIGVITNVRMDHIDKMGNSPAEIARALGNTIPESKLLLTSEKKNFNLLQNIAAKRNTEIVLADAEEVSDSEILGFSYLEHKDNVALALAVCRQLGIDRETALRGMYKAKPDAGVLKRISFNDRGKEFDFYNLLAANDPQSSLMIWKILKETKDFPENVVIILNSRSDRTDRARQLINMISAQLKGQFDHLFLTGESEKIIRRMALESGIQPDLISSPGQTDPENIYQEIFTRANQKTAVIAFGNMGAGGSLIAEYFENTSTNI